MTMFRYSDSSPFGRKKTFYLLVFEINWYLWTRYLKWSFLEIVVSMLILFKSKSKALIIAFILLLGLKWFLLDYLLIDVLFITDTFIIHSWYILRLGLFKLASRQFYFRLISWLINCLEPNSLYFFLGKVWSPSCPFHQN